MDLDLECSRLGRERLESRSFSKVRFAIALHHGRASSRTVRKICEHKDGVHRNLPINIPGKNQSIVPMSIGTRADQK